MLIIKPARKIDKVKIQKFLHLNFKKNHIISKNSKFFNWQYRNSDGKINCTLALKNKEIVGVYFYVPLGKFDKKLNKKRHVFGSTWTIKGFRSSKMPNLYMKSEKKNLLTNVNNESTAIALKIFWNIILCLFLILINI